jgi:hypothetical protein
MVAGSTADGGLLNRGISEILCVNLVHGLVGTESGLL